MITTTCLLNAGYKIGDFGGTGEFVPEGWRNKYYVQGVGTNNGTMRWRPEDSDVKDYFTGMVELIINLLDFTDLPHCNKYQYGLNLRNRNRSCNDFKIEETSKNLRLRQMSKREFAHILPCRSRFNEVK